MVNIMFLFCYLADHVYTDWVILHGCLLRGIYRRSDVGRGGRKHDGEAEEVVEGWWNDDGSGVPGRSKKRGSLGRERR